MDKRKTIVVAAGRIEGHRWDMRVRVNTKGGFTPSFIWIEGRDASVRDKDLHYFRDRLPKTFLEGKEIHHDWENGATCFLLEVEKHKRLHNV